MTTKLTIIALIGLSPIVGGCGTENTTNGPVSENAQANAGGEITDPCCLPSENGEPLAGECQDDFALQNNVCENNSSCCEGPWTADCAAAYSTFAASCTPPSGSESPNAERSGGGDVQVPDFNQYPLIQARLTVTVGDGLKVEHGANLFLVGFEEVEERSGLPAKGSQPIHYETLQPFVKDFPFERDEIELGQGLHYWIMYSSGEHPGEEDPRTPLLQASETHQNGHIILALGPPNIPGQPTAAPERQDGGE